MGLTSATTSCGMLRSPSAIPCAPPSGTRSSATRLNTLFRVAILSKSVLQSALLRCRPTSSLRLRHTLRAPGLPREALHPRIRLPPPARPQGHSAGLALRLPPPVPLPLPSPSPRPTSSLRFRHTLGAPGLPREALHPRIRLPPPARPQVRRPPT